MHDVFETLSNNIFEPTWIFSTFNIICVPKIQHSDTNMLIVEIKNSLKNSNFYKQLTCQIVLFDVCTIKSNSTSNH